MKTRSVQTATNQTRARARAISNSEVKKLTKEWLKQTQSGMNIATKTKKIKSKKGLEARKTNKTAPAGRGKTKKKSFPCTYLNCSKVLKRKARLITHL